MDDSDGLGRLGVCPCPLGSIVKLKSIKSPMVVAIFVVMHMLTLAKINIHGKHMTY